MKLGEEKKRRRERETHQLLLFQAYVQYSDKPRLLPQFGDFIPRVMPVNLSTLTVCLLGTAILCADISPASSNNTSTPTAPSVSPEDTPTNASTLAPSTTGTNTSAPGTRPTSNPTEANSTMASTSDQANEEATETILSTGEIAGIAVGSIAGVAAIGGGIFAGLKFSGKLAG
ncbi:mucin-2-like isoform X2 [Salvelinus fontinalis]|uniref:mucin-2-like isoform X2 n=1 Tax=Salvelinus fontinalis TaxID=8038 RepID=UPI002485680A|nr:mucin-2-like isoform X2 [Salvelinus fontinalis]